VKTTGGVELSKAGSGIGNEEGQDVSYYFNSLGVWKRRSLQLLEKLLDLYQV
jgi:hypothetical protein